MIETLRASSLSFGSANNLISAREAYNAHLADMQEIAGSENAKAISETSKKNVTMQGQGNKLDVIA